MMKLVLLLLVLYNSTQGTAQKIEIKTQNQNTNENINTHMRTIFRLSFFSRIWPPSNVTALVSLTLELKDWVSYWVSYLYSALFGCKITSNMLGVLLMCEVEMFKLGSKSRQRKCIIFNVRKIELFERQILSSSLNRMVFSSELHEWDITTLSETVLLFHIFFINSSLSRNPCNNCQRLGFHLL